MNHMLIVVFKAFLDIHPHLFDVKLSLCHELHIFSCSVCFLSCVDHISLTEERLLRKKQKEMEKRCPSLSPAIYTPKDFPPFLIYD